MSSRTAKIRFRIAVTGTRGKSTVTRLIASILREAGYSVLARTTGSKPVLILPDGREEEIKRRGKPSLLEGKRILKKAAALNADALVVEMMSIQPECLRVESSQLLRPQILVMTNVRLDHCEEQGRSKPEIAASLASAIPPRATVFLLEEELRPEFEAVAAKRGAKVVAIPKMSTNGFSRLEVESLPVFEENIRLALAVTDSLGISRKFVARGVERARPDFGSLKAWKAEIGNSPGIWTLVSAFAANEPESTAFILSYLNSNPELARLTLLGILNFREDRGDRSLQWLEAGQEGLFSSFKRVYFVGAHVHCLRLRKLAKQDSRLIPVALTSPQKIMDKIIADEPKGALLLGMGNMGGLGAKLVELWERIGKPHAI